MKKLIMVLVIFISIVGCSSDASVASYNLSKEAEQFRIYRRVVFFNGITNDYILSIEGYCSIETRSGRLEVTVKDDKGKYLKHFLGLSDNVTYFAEQLSSEFVSDTRYKVIFKPSSIIPNVEIK